MKQQRPSATSARKARYGAANQMAHESRERVERNALKAKMAESKAGVMRNTAKRAGNKAKETGMNAGTAGGGTRGRKNLVRRLFGM